MSRTCKPRIVQMNTDGNGGMRAFLGPPRNLTQKCVGARIEGVRGDARRDAPDGIGAEAIEHSLGRFPVCRAACVTQRACSAISAGAHIRIIAASNR